MVVIYFTANSKSILDVKHNNKIIFFNDFFKVREYSPAAWIPHSRPVFNISRCPPPHSNVKLDIN